MSAEDWLVLLTLGAFMGAAGQGARMMIGIKKMSDEAAATASSVRAMIVPSQLVTSLIIGAIAGVIGVVSMQLSGADKLEVKELVTLLFIGYSGADFIEGFIRREAPREPTTSPVITTTTTPGVQTTLGAGPQINLSGAIQSVTPVG